MEAAIANFDPTCCHHVVSRMLHAESHSDEPRGKYITYIRDETL